MDDWQPSISVRHLQQRARLLTQARAFFLQRGITEVETPLLGLHTVTEPNLNSFKVFTDTGTRFLQTSPEYAMKRLLAAGAGDIYQICKSFRAQECGARHNPEFTLIEWYRHNFSLQQIMQETAAFIGQLLFGVNNSCEIIYKSYNDACRPVLGISLPELTTSQLETIAVDNGLVASGAPIPEQLYDFIFSSVVVPTFVGNNITVVFDYPASQASLAKLNAENPQLAQRFEVFYNGQELANGFVELTDANEQLDRFKQDQKKRSQQGLPEVDIDYRLIAALQHGFPNCAGVAVGFDRIVMLATNAKSISEAISFDWKSA